MKKAPMPGRNTMDSVETKTAGTKTTGSGLKKIVSVICIAAAVYALLWSYACGFRWPSNYVMTNHVITYIYGFVPRGLVGEIGLLLFGHKWYAWKYLSVVILAVAMVFVIWTLLEIIRNGYGFKNLPVFTLLAVFAVSPFAKFYIHEAGYYEQYGYVFIILLLLFFMKDTVASVYIIPCILSFISLLISETNIFLVVPVIFMFSFLRIINPDPACPAKGASQKSSLAYYIKRVGLLLATYIPHLIYCAVIWVYKMPSEMVDRLQSHDRDMVNNGFSSYNFTFREDVHLFLSGDRSNADKWARELHPMNPWCIAFCLLVIIFVSYLIYRHKKDMKLLISYIFSAVTAGFASYIIVLVAWDLDRYFFNTFMSIFFVSVFVARKHLKDIKPDRVDIVMVCAVMVLSLGLGVNRFALFDDAVYNTTWQDFLSLLKGKLT